MELHRRMGHIAPESACVLIKEGRITGVKLNPTSCESTCDHCIYARATCQPVPKVREGPPSLYYGEEIHTDVGGPTRVATKRGCQYYITFTDDATRYTVTYLLRAKSEALDAYKSFEAWAKTQQFCSAIRVLRSDRGGEYFSEEFDTHLKSAGTVRRLTVHDMPQLNGVAERLNCTLMERVHVFSHSTGLPKFLWGEAIRHTTWLHNRTATHALDGLTPYQALFGSPPDMSGICNWGSIVWVHDDTKYKLDPRAREGRWVGFDTESRAHQVYFPSTRNVTVERNIYFGVAPRLEGEQIIIPGTEHEQRPTPQSAGQPPKL